MSQEHNSNIIDKIRSFLFDVFIYGLNSNELGNDDLLLEIGVLDSTGVMELVSFVEREFEIEVLDDEIIPENFESVNRLSLFIQQKLTKPVKGNNDENL